MKWKSIWTIIWVNLIRWMPWSEKKPYKVMLQVTDLCNSRCQHCHIWKVSLQDPDYEAKELGINDYEKFFSEYGQHILWLTLIGGEVTIYPHIDALIGLIKKYCPHLRIVAFTTNALEPDKAVSLAKSILINGWDPLITISLDGDEKIHDKIRGVPGNFARATELKRTFTRLKIPASFGITIVPGNAEFVKSQYHEWKDEIKAINTVYSSGIYRKTNDINGQFELPALNSVIKHYQIRSAGELIEYLFLRLSKKFIQTNRTKSPLPCEVLSTSFHVMPSGKVHGCMFMDSVGGLKEKTMTEILSSEEWKNQHEQVRALNCPQCWMNCYAPHSMMAHPLKTLKRALC